MNIAQIKLKKNTITLTILNDEIYEADKNYENTNDDCCDDASDNMNDDDDDYNADDDY